MMAMAMGYFIEHDPSPILMVQPRDTDVKEWSKEMVQATIDITPALKTLVAAQRAGNESNTLTHKEYPGGPLRLRASNSADGFRRYTARIAMLDEIDAYPASVGVDGSFVGLVYGRVQDWWNYVIALGSTPTEEGVSHIDREGQGASMGYPILECPHCNAPHIRQFKQPKKPIVLRGEKWPVSHLVYDLADTSTAVYVCPSCGGAIDHKHHADMLDACYWVGEHWGYKDGEFEFLPGFKGKICFRPWAGYNTSPNTTPERLATRWEDDKRDIEKRKAFVNTVLAEVYHEEGETLDADVLAARCEVFPSHVPDLVMFIALGVDVQADRLEVEIVGWGAGEESWSLGYEVLPGDPLKDDVWDDLTELIGQEYSRADGSKMVAGAVGIDHGYLSHRVNTYVRAQGSAQIFAVKGVEGERPIVEDTNTRRRRIARSSKSKAKPELMGVDAAKTVLYRRLKNIREPGPGYCHFPEGREMEYFLMLTAERKKTTYKHGRPKITWTKIRSRNEALDCRNIAYAGLLIADPDLSKPQVIRRIPPKKARVAAPNPFASQDWLL